MDFIKNKIIIRSILSSIVPIALYTIGYAFYRATNIYEEFVPYGNKNSWLAILAVSALYPLNWVWLKCLFAPMEALIESKLSINKSKNPILNANFAAVSEEKQYEITNILEGSIPQDITGYYLRNGPNPKHIPKNNRQHWFDGDGMIHAIVIKEGKMHYCNRFTRTPLYERESKLGRADNIRLGEMVS